MPRTIASSLDVRPVRGEEPDRARAGGPDCALRGPTRSSRPLLPPECPRFSGTSRTRATSRPSWRRNTAPSTAGGGRSIYEEIRKAGFKFELLTQVALAKQWIGPGNDSDGSQKEVTIALPVETGESIVVSEQTPPTTKTVPIPKHFEATRSSSAWAGTRTWRTMSRRRRACPRRRGSGRSKRSWMLDAYVSELHCIHTKLMGVDDRRVIPLKHLQDVEQCVRYGTLRKMTHIYY
ncbi:hypothetical protein DFH06DRAFT_113351 [Mycena polygramma]|nr:hypothetical protein DFH06DRAFT_113351 [Mycena polygramma]